MNTFAHIITDIFDNGADAPRMDLFDEQDAIADAKSGDNAATEQLMLAYAPAIRNAIKGYMRATANTDRSDIEDARMEVVAAFIEAVNAFDPAVNDRLGAVLHGRFANAQKNLSAQRMEFRVPDRMLSKFYAHMRAHGQDVQAAVDALEPGASDDDSRDRLSRKTFLQILASLRGVESYTVDNGDSADAEDTVSAAFAVASSDEYSAVEDALMVRVAFEAVDAIEEQVVRHLYGFESYGEPKTVSHTAYDLNITRAKATRTRASALGKMRATLGVTV